MVFRATNNRCGIYEYRGIDIFFDAKSLTEDIVKRRFSKPKDEIVGAIKTTEEGVSDESGLKPVLEFLRSQVDQYYEDLRIQVGQEIYNILRSDKCAPLENSNPFWEKIQDRWGKGKGYRDDVLQMYNEQLEGIEEFLRNKAATLWSEHFMTETLAFFEED